MTVAIPEEDVLVEFMFGGCVGTRQAIINMHDPRPKAPTMKGIRRPPMRSRTKTWKVSTPTTFTTPKKPVTRLAALPARTEEKVWLA